MLLGRPSLRKLDLTGIPGELCDLRPAMLK